MTVTTRRCGVMLAAMLAAATLSLGLAACGSGDTTATSTTTGTRTTGTKTTEQARPPSSGELYDQLRKSAAAAKSVHIKGEVTDKGKKVKIDLAGDRDGKNTKAVINDGTGQVEILSVAGQTYLKADPAFWKANGQTQLATLVGSKYLKVPAGQRMGMEQMQVGSLLDELFRGKMSSVDKIATKVETGEINGTKAYILTDRLGEGAKLYVSADGKARLLRAQGGKSQPGSLDFSEWDAVPAPKAPAKDEILAIPGM